MKKETEALAETVREGLNRRDFLSHEALTALLQRIETLTRELEARTQSKRALERERNTFVRKADGLLAERISLRDKLAEAEAALERITEISSMSYNNRAQVIARAALRSLRGEK